MASFLSSQRYPPWKPVQWFIAVQLDINRHWKAHAVGERPCRVMIVSLITVNPGTILRSSSPDLRLASINDTSEKDMKMKSMITIIHYR